MMGNNQQDDNNDNNNKNKLHTSITATAATRNNSINNNDHDFTTPYIIVPEEKDENANHVPPSTMMVVVMPSPPPPPPPPPTDLRIRLTNRSWWWRRWCQGCWSWWWRQQGCHDDGEKRRRRSPYLHEVFTDDFASHIPPRLLSNPDNFYNTTTSATTATATITNTNAPPFSLQTFVQDMSNTTTATYNNITLPSLINVGLLYYILHSSTREFMSQFLILDKDIVQEEAEEDMEVLFENSSSGGSGSRSSIIIITAFDICVLIVAFLIHCILQELYYQQQHIELQQKVQYDWKPLLASQYGFMVVLLQHEYNTYNDTNNDDDCLPSFSLVSSDLYVHMKQRPLSSPRTPPTSPTTSSTSYISYYIEEVQYLIIYSRMFVRRNQHMRDILECSHNNNNSNNATNIVKPPQLLNLQDDIFYSMMDEIVMATTKAETNRYCFHVVICWLSIILLAFIISICLQQLVLLILYCTGNHHNNENGNGDDDDDDTMVFLIPLFISIFCITWIDQYIILHEFPSQFPNLIDKEWKFKLEQLTNNEFTISYHIDQPYWYNWKETYIHISRIKKKKEPKQRYQLKDTTTTTTTHEPKSNNIIPCNCSDKVGYCNNCRVGSAGQSDAELL